MSTLASFSAGEFPDMVLAVFHCHVVENFWWFK